jgi:hypothetical protein
MRDPWSNSLINSWLTSPINSWLFDGHFMAFASGSVARMSRVCILSAGNCRHETNYMVFYQSHLNYTLLYFLFNILVVNQKNNSNCLTVPRYNKHLTFFVQVLHGKYPIMQQTSIIINCIKQNHYNQQHFK